MTLSEMKLGIFTGLFPITRCMNSVGVYTAGDASARPVKAIELKELGVISEVIDSSKESQELLHNELNLLTG
jgi:enoyl-CoA hydratase/carnithine racemase